ncbi:GNAT family N-acetyltransferase [Aquibacillus rhizosphaerae]|uniref:GNAT family N-acetyltransferase n=1 Tax=Aquibacillus rhizosphaerae TaxID=3051431 RepID=A0ABT7L5E6_9BACI|nr:GNAT family N-acetyltransferase [Aquibacillus sp. LR5S19]MDL4841078.1 GNAT family N-acetyltransferase [Aquibacillus sp. LR5S19]
MFVEEKNKLEEDIVAISCLYREAFGDDEYTEKDLNIIQKRIEKHSKYQGFKLVKCVNDVNDVIGFAYGYTSSVGQFYRSLLELHLNEEEKNKWLSDCFEVVELAVSPTYRRKGIGTEVHDNLLTGLSHETAILTTQIDNYKARSLYMKMGWRTIKEALDLMVRAPTMTLYGKHLHN